MLSRNTNPSTTSTTSSRPIFAFLGGFALALVLSLVFLVPIARAVGGEADSVPHSQSPAQKVLVAQQFAKTVYHIKRADNVAHLLKTHDALSHRRVVSNLNLTFETKRATFWKTRADAWHARWQTERRQALIFAKGSKDFHVALRLAVKQWGGSYERLHSCAHSEGHIHGHRHKNGVPQRHLGIDPFVLNRGGSRAGGQAQFMKSTYDAYPQARSMVPHEYRQWDDKIGQAFTMAYVVRVDGGFRQWTGAGC